MAPGEPGSSWLYGDRPAKRRGELPRERPGISRPTWTSAAPRKKQLCTSKHLVRGIQCEKQLRLWVRGDWLRVPCRGLSRALQSQTGEVGSIGRSPTPRPSRPVWGQSTPRLLQSLLAEFRNNRKGFYCAALNENLFVSWNCQLLEEIKQFIA